MGPISRGLSRFLLVISGQRWRSQIRWAAIALFVLVFVAGWIGWQQDHREEERQVLDFWTTLYRTGGLFLFDSIDSEANPPLLLQLARLVAPSVIAISSLIAGLTFAHDWANRFAARRTADHVVFVGSPTRICSYGDLTRRSSSYDLGVVHVVDDKEQAADCIADHLHVVKSTDWTTTASVRAAQRVVLATGSDVRNIELEGDARAALGTCERTEVDVEIEDHRTAVGLAVATVIESPRDRIDIYDAAAMEARWLAGEFGSAIDRTNNDGPEPWLAVVGDSFRSRAIVDLLVLQLQRRHKTTGTRSALRVVASNAEELSANLPSSHGVTVDPFTDFGSFAAKLVELPLGTPVLAAVVEEDADVQMRVALTIIGRSADARAWVPHCASPLPSRRLLPLDDARGDGPGIWQVVTEDLIADRDDVTAQWQGSLGPGTPAFNDLEFAVRAVIRRLVVGSAVTAPGYADQTRFLIESESTHATSGGETGEFTDAPLLDPDVVREALEDVDFHSDAAPVDDIEVLLKDLPAVLRRSGVFVYERVPHDQLTGRIR